MSNVLGIRLQEDLRARLESEAAHDRRPVSQFARILLEDGLRLRSAQRSEAERLATAADPTELDWR
jgi:hypothetical protein